MNLASLEPTVAVVVGLLTILGFVAGTFYRMGRYGYIIERFDKHIHDNSIWRNNLEHELTRRYAGKEATDEKFRSLNQRITHVEQRIDS